MKKIFVFFGVAVAILTSSAHAASIGRPSGSTSRPSSIGTVKSSYKPTYAPSPRPTAPTYTPKPTYVPSPSYTQRSYDSPKPTVNVTKNYNSGSSGSGSFWSHAGAFGAGAVVGHVLTPTRPAPVQPVFQQAPAPVQPVVQQTYQEPQPAVQSAGQPVVNSYQQKQSETSSWFGWFFGLVALGLIGFVGYKFLMKKENDSIGKDLPFTPIRKFMTIQNAYGNADAEKLAMELGPNMADQMLLNLPKENLKNPGLINISYRVEEHTKNFIAIRYYFVDTDEGNAQREEVWNFILNGSLWQLDGIQQLA